MWYCLDSAFWGETTTRSGFDDSVHIKPVLSIRTKTTAQSVLSLKRKTTKNKVGETS